MSYILDALRKSDQQRQHGAAPTLASVQFPAPEARRRKYVRLTGVAAVLFVAGILIGWWRPWQGVPPQSAVPSAAAPIENVLASSVPAAAPQPPALAAASPLAQTTGSERVPAGQPLKSAEPRMLTAAVVAPTAPPPIAPIAPALVATNVAAADGSRTEKAQRDVPGRTDTTLSGKRAAAEPNAPPIESKVMSRSELPGSIQQELPKLSVSLHAYSSKPGNRLVSVNDQLLHEGDSLAPGLVLEQIRSDDMVFSYKGFLFRQGLQ